METYAQTTASISYCQIYSSIDTNGALLNIQNGANPYVFDHFVLSNNTVGSKYGVFWTDSGAYYATFTYCCLSKNSFNTLMICGNSNGGGKYPSMIACSIDFSATSIQGSHSNIMFTSGCKAETEWFTEKNQDLVSIAKIIDTAFLILC